MSFKKNATLILLILILLVGFASRTYRLDNPIADWHSWRQADTAAVARNFVKDGFDLLHPRMNNISNVQSGLENPEGYFFAEFPIYNALYAGLFVTFDHFTLEEWGRLVTAFNSMLATLFIFFITRRHSNEKIGLWAAGFYALIPYNIYYGRVILPEPSMVMAILGGINFFDLWISDNGKKGEKNKKILFYFLAIFFMALALLIKPVAAFFTLPLFYLAIKRFGWKMILHIELWLFLILSVAPLIWWRYWESQYPAGIPSYLWLFNSNGILFHGAFFRWIFYERMTKLIAGYVGIIFILAGLTAIVQHKKERWFFLSIIASALLYVFTLATGNVQHDYYQIAGMPALAICMGFGAVWIISSLRKRVSAIVAYTIVGVVIVSSFYFGWQQVKDYFNINNPSIIIAGEAVKQFTPKDALVIADYNGDSSFLYQMDRQGWASLAHDLPIMISMGADYLVIANPKEVDMSFARDYRVLAHTKEYVIFDLRRPPATQ